MDRRAVLAVFDDQMRRLAGGGGEEGRVECEERVTRWIGGEDGWNGVLWSDLGEATADAAIAAQIQRFAGLGCGWEWKHYGHDRPLDLPARLMAAGFRGEATETLLAAEIANLPLEMAPPTGVEIRPVVDEAGCRGVRARPR